MKTATITCAWTGTGSKVDPYRPVLGDQYALQSWQDMSATPVATIRKGGATCQIQVKVQNSVLTLIQADVRYAGKITGVS